MSKREQNLPSWFDGTIYDEGATVRNPFSGEEFELNSRELSMYDLVKGIEITIVSMFVSGPAYTKLIKTQRKGLDWFRQNAPEAYMALLD
jgi:hypothetical protein